MTGIESDLSDLENLIEQGFDVLGDRYGYISYSPYLNDQGDTAQVSDVEEFLDDTADFYDGLLQVDSTDLRENFKDRTVYDPGKLERAKLIADPPGERLEFEDLSLPKNASIYGGMLGAGFLSSVLLGDFGAILAAGGSGYILNDIKRSTEDSMNRLGGTYFSDTKTIGVSTEKTQESDAYTTLTSELLHAFQDDFNSPTYNHPTLCEGMDVAVTNMVYNHFDRSDKYENIDWDWLRDQKWMYSMLHAWGDLHQPEEPGMDFEAFNDIVKDHGLEENDVNSMLREFQNHHHRHSKNLSEYYVGSAGLFVAEALHGPEIYSEVFQGDFDLLPEWVEEYTDYVRNRDY